MTRDLNARLQSLVDDVLDRLRAEQDIPSAFALAGWLATLLWRNHSRIYRLDALETILLEKLPPLPLGPVAPQETSSMEIHLATEVYRSGGHTPLMAHLIQQTDQPVSVLLTRMIDTQLAAQALGVSPDKIHSAGQETHLVARVHALAQQLIKGARVIASLHTNDIVGAVALRMAKGVRPDLPIGFMNHADHLFSAGIGISDHVFEISAYGWGLREARGTTGQSSFVGIPISPRTAAAVAPTASSAAPVQAPIFLTGGAPYKFRPLPGLSLQPALAELMRRHKTARLTVLGPKPRDWWWWPLRAGFRGRVQVLRAIPKERYQQLLQDCSVYIDSHPVSGGTALPEALMTGRHIAGLRGVVWGYSCADELLDTNSNAFQTSCARLIEGVDQAVARQQAIRARCADWHAPDAVRRRLDEAWSGTRHAPPTNLDTSSSPERPLERLWLEAGRVAHPGRREFPLNRTDKKWLAHRNLVHFGWCSWSTLKLLFYAHVRS